MKKIINKKSFLRFTLKTKLRMYLSSNGVLEQRNLFSSMENPAANLQLRTLLINSRHD